MTKAEKLAAAKAKAAESIANTQNQVRSQIVTPQIGGILSKIKFVAPTKAETMRQEKATASVRQNGQVVFNAVSTKLIGFPEIAIASVPAVMDGATIVTPEQPATTKPRTYFRVGSDEAGNIYLVPATAETPDVLKATKNNEGMQFRRDDVFAGMGAKYKDGYTVSAELDEETGTEFYKLTLHRDAPVTKPDTAESPKTETPAEAGEEPKA